MVTSAEAGGATVSNGAAAAFAAGVATAAAAASTATSSSKATRPSSTTSVGFSHRVVVEPVHGGSTSGYRTHCPWPTTTTDFQRQTGFKLTTQLIARKKKKRKKSLSVKSNQTELKTIFFQRQLFSSPPSLTFIVSSVSTVPTVRTTSEHQSSLSSPSTPPTKHTGAKKEQPGGWLSGWMGEVPPTRCVDSGALKVCLARAGATIALCSGRS